MIRLLAILAAVAASAAVGQPQGAPDPAVERLVALYDEVCLKAFPDNAAVDTLMAAKGARALTAEEVRVTFRDDPGRGWLLEDGDRPVQIMLELPPYHACSVRRTTAQGFGDLSAYRAVADAYKHGRPGFEAIEEQRTEMAGLDIRAWGEIRPMPDGGAETLYLFDQRVIDPARRAAGETAVSIRFVHQIMSPGAR